MIPTAQIFDITLILTFCKFGSIWVEYYFEILCINILSDASILESGHTAGLESIRNLSPCLTPSSSQCDVYDAFN